MRKYFSEIDKMQVTLEMLSSKDYNDICLSYGPVSEYHEMVKEYIDLLIMTLYNAASRINVPLEISTEDFYASEDVENLTKFEDRHHLKRTFDIWGTIDEWS